MAELDGATRMPEPNAYASDAGEFAARWNAMSPEMREAAVASIQSNGETSLRCVLENHVGSMTAHVFETAGDLLRAGGGGPLPKLTRFSSARLRAIADECEEIIRERAADGVFD